MNNNNFYIQFIDEKRKKILNKAINRPLPLTIPLFRNHSTLVYDLLCDPIKKAFIYVISLLILANLLRLGGILKNLIRIQNMNIYIFIIIILFCYIYINQYNTNKDIIFLTPMLPENATLFHYRQHKRHDNSQNLMRILFSTVMVGYITELSQKYF